MPIIAGNRLWNQKFVTIPADTTVLVPHGLQCSPAEGFVAANMWIDFVPPITTNPAPSIIEIGAITETTVEMTNTSSGEGASEITVNVRFVMPHTLIGPGDSEGYEAP